MTKNLDEAVSFQSEKKEWTREVRGERLQGITDGRTSAPVWPAHQSRRISKEISVWAFGDPLIPDSKGEERRQFLPDLSEGLW